MLSHIDIGPYLRWTIPYRRKDGTDDKCILLLATTKEAFDKDRFHQQDVQDALDKYLKANGETDGNEK